MKSSINFVIFLYAYLSTPAALAETADWTGTLAVSPFDIQKIQFESGTNNNCQNVIVPRVERRDCQVEGAYLVGAGGKQLAKFSRVTIFVKVLSSEVIREYHYYGTTATTTDMDAPTLTAELAFWHEIDQKKLVGSYSVGNPSSSWGLAGQLN